MTFRVKGIKFLVKGTLFVVKGIPLRVKGIPFRVKGIPFEVKGIPIRGKRIPCGIKEAFLAKYGTFSTLKIDFFWDLVGVVIELYKLKNDLLK